jgi:hypothetical protein
MKHAQNTLETLWERSNSLGAFETCTKYEERMGYLQAQKAADIQPRGIHSVVLAQ